MEMESRGGKLLGFSFPFLYNCSARIPALSC